MSEEDAAKAADAMSSNVGLEAKAKAKSSKQHGHPAAAGRANVEWKSKKTASNTYVAAKKRAGASVDNQRQKKKTATASTASAAAKPSATKPSATKPSASMSPPIVSAGIGTVRRIPPRKRRPKHRHPQDCEFEESLEQAAVEATSFEILVSDAVEASMLAFYRSNEYVYNGSLSQWLGIPERAIAPLPPAGVLAQDFESFPFQCYEDYQATLSLSLMKIMKARIRECAKKGGRTRGGNKNNDASGGDGPAGDGDDGPGDSGHADGDGDADADGKGNKGGSPQGGNQNEGDHTGGSGAKKSGGGRKGGGGASGGGGDPGDDSAPALYVPLPSDYEPFFEYADRKYLEGCKRDGLEPESNDGPVPNEFDDATSDTDSECSEEYEGEDYFDENVESSCIESTLAFQRVKHHQDQVDSSVLDKSVKRLSNLGGTTYSLYDEGAVCGGASNKNQNEIGVGIANSSEKYLLVNRTDHSGEVESPFLKPSAVIKNLAKLGVVAVKERDEDDFYSLEEGEVTKLEVGDFLKISLGTEVHCYCLVRRYLGAYYGQPSQSVSKKSFELYHSDKKSSGGKDLYEAAMHGHEDDDEVDDEALRFHDTKPKFFWNVVPQDFKRRWRCHNVGHSLSTKLRLKPAEEGIGLVVAEACPDLGIVEGGYIWSIDGTRMYGDPGWEIEFQRVLSSVLERDKIERTRFKRMYGSNRPPGTFSVVTTDVPVLTKRDMLTMWTASSPSFIRWQQATYHKFGIFMVPPSSEATNLADIETTFTANFPSFNSGRALFDAGLGVGNVAEGVCGVVARPFSNSIKVMGKEGVVHPQAVHDALTSTAFLDIFPGAGPSRWSKSKDYNTMRTFSDPHFLSFYKALLQEIREARFGPQPSNWVQCDNCGKWRCFRPNESELFSELVESETFECGDQGRGFSCNLKEETLDSVRSEYQKKTSSDLTVENPCGKHAEMFFQSYIATERAVVGDVLRHGEYFFRSNKSNQENSRLIRTLRRTLYPEHHQDLLPELPDFIVDGVVGSNDPNHPVGLRPSAPDWMRKEWNQRGGQKVKDAIKGGQAGSNLTTEQARIYKAWKDGQVGLAAAFTAHHKGTATEEQESVVLAKLAGAAPAKNRSNEHMGAYEEENKAKWVKVECPGGCQTDYDRYCNTFVRRDVLRQKVPGFSDKCSFLGGGKAIPTTANFSCGKEWWGTAGDFCREFSNRTTVTASNLRERLRTKTAKEKGYCQVQLTNPKETVNLKFGDNDDNYSPLVVVLGSCGRSKSSGKGKRLKCTETLRAVNRDTRHHHYNAARRMAIVATVSRSANNGSVD